MRAVAAPASAEKDYDVGALGPGPAEAKWQGTGSGVLATQDAMDEAGCTPGVHDCYDAVIEIKSPGKLVSGSSSSSRSSMASSSGRRREITCGCMLPAYFSPAPVRERPRRPTDREAV